MGLLDQMFAAPDSAPALGLLGAGLMAGNAPAGFQSAIGLLAGSKDRELERQYKAAQMQDVMQQIELRKQQAGQLQRRNDMINGWLGQMDASVPTANASVAAQTGNLSPSLKNAGLQTQEVQRLNANNPIANIPRSAITADLAFNDGKNIADWMFKRGTPNIEFVNGVAIDKNAINQGFSVPTVSQSGQASQTIMDPTAPGGFRVIAPQGALDTYRAYKSADADIAAQNEVVKVYDPAQRRDVYMRRSDVLRGPTPGQQTPPAPSMAPAAPAPAGLPPAQPGVTGNYVGDPAQIMEGILNIKDPQERANAMAAFQEQAKRTKGFAQGSNFAAGPSASEDAQRSAGIKQAEADVQPTAQRKNDIANANYMLSLIGMMKEHPGLDTATGLSGSLDPRNYVPGTDAKNFQVLRDQLKGNVFLQAYANLKGGGQITEVEGAKAENALARLSTAQSSQEFRKALGEFEGVLQNSLTRLKSGAEAAGVRTSFPGDNANTGNANLPKPMVGMVRNGYRFLGGDPATPNSWQKVN